jgi:predicted nucleic acid-binding protein
MRSSSKPTLDVWDTCCIIGLFNNEKDKVPALLAQTQLFESGAVILGLPIAVLDEVITLADGSSAETKLREFLENPYVLRLQSNVEVSFLSKNLRVRFDGERSPEVTEKALLAGVSKKQAKKLAAKDSEILATAIFYKADRLTTYDPFLIFLGKQYLQKEFGIIIAPPTSDLFPFPEEQEASTPAQTDQP